MKSRTQDPPSGVTPAQDPVHPIEGGLEALDGITVAVPDEIVPTWAADDVRALAERLRDARGTGTLEDLSFPPAGSDKGAHTMSWEETRSLVYQGRGG